MAVVQYLVSAGIDSKRLTYIGYGFEQPIATNETDAGRQLNRRTEFRIAGGAVNNGIIIGNYLSDDNIEITENINPDKFQDLVDYNHVLLCTLVLKNERN